MTNEEAYKMIGERAEQLAHNAIVKSEMQARYMKNRLKGMTEEQAAADVESFVYQLAIATLCGVK